MAKKAKKRKPVRSYQPPGRKVEARLMARYRERLLEICNVLGARALMEKLPEREMKIMYLIRLRQPQVKLEKKLAKHSHITKHLNQELDKCLKAMTFRFPGSSVDLPAPEYFTYILTIKHWLLTLRPNQAINKNEIEQKLRPLLELTESRENPQAFAEGYYQFQAYRMTHSPDKYLYYFTIEEMIVSFPRPVLKLNYVLKVKDCERRKVSFNGKKREVFRVYAWEAAEIYNLVIDGRAFGKGNADRKELEVYIQKHSLERLNERLDIFDLGSLYGALANSLLLNKPLPGRGNKVLVPYHYFGHLLGYLPIELVEDIAVIKTFLFLTNDGTPQGRKLQRRLGLGKIDKAYTGLDKLSTYAHGDLNEDETLCSILEESNCKHLLNLDDALISLGETKKAQMDAEMIKRYLWPELRLENFL